MRQPANSLAVARGLLVSLHRQRNAGVGFDGEGRIRPVPTRFQIALAGGDDFVHFYLQELSHVAFAQDLMRPMGEGRQTLVFFGTQTPQVFLGAL